MNTPSQLTHVYFNAKNGEHISIQTWVNAQRTIVGIQTNLCKAYQDERNEKPWDIAINALTCLILEQASCGVHALTEDYKQSVSNAVEHLSNRYGDN